MSLSNNKPRLKVAWSSNHPNTPSGYSNQTADIKKLFLQSGWDTETFVLYNMYGQHGYKVKDADNIWNYPLMDHNVGSDAMIHHSVDFKPDVIISLQDVWPLNPQDLAGLPTRWIPWTPIDYNPVPKPILGNLRFANRIISMSLFGHKQLQDNGFASTYIPHGVFTDVFTPLDKKQRKLDAGINPDTFIFGMVSANKEQINPRKSFQQVMEAFKLFLEKKPNSLLYIHTDPKFPGGFPLEQFAEFLGITQHIMYPERYKTKFNTSKPDMNLIYNTFDCLLQPSASEGFGIPIIEAQACGVPVITHDWTAMPELIIDTVTGYKVKTGFKIYYPIGSYMAWPDVQDLFDKMMYVSGMDREKMGKSARRHIEENYAWDKLWVNNWLPFLGKLELEIYGPLS